jgi:hypothetical protein
MRGVEQFVEQNLADHANEPPDLPTIPQVCRRIRLILLNPTSELPSVTARPHAMIVLDPSLPLAARCNGDESLLSE